MKFTNVKQLIIKFMGGGIINFPTRFLRWVKINGDSDDSDDGGGDTPVSNVKPWLKGLCINENLPEGVIQLEDCFHNAGFVRKIGNSYIKLTDEEISNYNEENLVGDSYINCLFDSEKIDEYLTREGITIPEIGTTVDINYSNSLPRFLTRVYYYYQTYLSYNLNSFRLFKTTVSDNKTYYIII